MKKMGKHVQSIHEKQATFWYMPFGLKRQDSCQFYVNFKWIMYYFIIAFLGGTSLSVFQPLHPINNTFDKL